MGVRLYVSTFDLPCAIALYSWAKFVSASNGTPYWNYFHFIRSGKLGLPKIMTNFVSRNIHNVVLYLYIKSFR